MNPKSGHRQADRNAEQTLNEAWSGNGLDQVPRRPSSFGGLFKPQTFLALHLTCQFCCAVSTPPTCGPPTHRLWWDTQSLSVCSILIWSLDAKPYFQKSNLKEIREYTAGESRQSNKPKKKIHSNSNHPNFLAFDLFLSYNNQRRNYTTVPPSLPVLCVGSWN